LNGPPPPVNPPVGSNGRYPLPPGIGINYFTDPLNSYRIPEVELWNVTIQQQLTHTMALQVAYVGNVGRHLFESLNRNQAVPGPGDVNTRRPFYNLYGLEQFIGQYCNCSNSNYNSLQTRFQKQFSHGVDFLLTYTWSKALDLCIGGKRRFADLSLSKNLLLSERYRLELRADAFNVFNHVNRIRALKSIPAARDKSRGSLLPMRQMQFGLHFQF
jgi:hypothetical protein